MTQMLCPEGPVISLLLIIRGKIRGKIRGRKPGRTCVELCLVYKATQETPHSQRQHNDRLQQFPLEVVPLSALQQQTRRAFEPPRGPLARVQARPPFDFPTHVPHADNDELTHE
jgi:hypothetical protein